MHRLDRETSGLLLIAKKKQALRALQDQFRERETGKTYLAVVKGSWPDRSRYWISRCTNTCCQMVSGASRWWRPITRMRMRSLTLVKVIQRLAPPDGLQSMVDTFTLLEVTIKTGRTHQIRVHLANAGHVILGDDKYGDFELNRQLIRSGLKAHVFACVAAAVATPTVE